MKIITKTLNYETAADIRTLNN